MDFLDRIGQLNIPNGLAGPQGPAGTNGAGWTSGSTNPTTAPPASIKFYLNTVSGQISEWNGSGWDPIVNTIFGTDGNIWFSGAVPPVTVPGAVANDFYLDTVTGIVYKLVGVNWVQQLTIKGTNGTNGTNGLDSGTVGFKYWNNSDTIIANTDTYNTILDETIETSSYQFCKIDGDSFRINFSTRACISRFLGSVTDRDLGSIGKVAFQFELGTQISGDTVLIEPYFDNNTFYNIAPVNILLPSPIYPLPVIVYPPTITTRMYLNISATITFHRVSNSNMFYQMVWTATSEDRSCVSNTYSNLVSFPFVNSPTKYKRFKVSISKNNPTTQVTANSSLVLAEPLNII